MSDTIDIVIRVEGKSPKGRASIKTLAPEIAKVLNDLGCVSVVLDGSLEWPPDNEPSAWVKRHGDLRDLAELGLEAVVLPGPVRRG